MQAQRYTAFIQADTMDLARSYGMTNFSGFVNQKIREYIEEERAKIRAQATPVKQV